MPVALRELDARADQQPGRVVGGERREPVEGRLPPRVGVDAAALLGGDALERSEAWRGV